VALKEGAHYAEVRRKSGFGRVLISSQIALGVLVLVTAGLLVRSLRNLQEVDLGYSRDQLLLARVDFLQSGYKGAAVQNGLRELLDRLATLPGVRSVSASSNGLFSGDESSDAILIDGSLPPTSKTMRPPTMKLDPTISVPSVCPLSWARNHTTGFLDGRPRCRRQ